MAIQHAMPSDGAATPAPAGAPDQNAGPYRWYVLAVLTAVYSLAQVDRRVASVVAEPIKLELGLSDGQIGALTGLVFGVPHALMLLPIGLMVDRVNRRTLCATMLGIWSAACALCGVATSYVQLLVARAAVGATEAGGSSTGLSMIADLFPARLRPVATAVFQAGLPIGTILSFTMVAYVAGEYGWRAAFVAAGVPGIFVAALLMLTVREPKRGASDAKPATATRPATLPDGFRFVTGQRDAFHYVIGPALVSAGSSGIQLWLPSFLIRAHGMSIAEAGFLLAIASGVLAAGGLALLGPIASAYAKDDATRLARVPIVTVIAATGFAAFALLAPSQTGVIVGLCLFGIFNYMYIGLGYSLLLGITPPTLRGTVLSIELIGANLLGYAGGPFLVGLLSDAIGGAQPLRGALLVILGLYVWGLLHLELGRRQIVKRKLAEAAAA